MSYIQSSPIIEAEGINSYYTASQELSEVSHKTVNNTTLPNSFIVHYSNQDQGPTQWIWEKQKK